MSISPRGGYRPLLAMRVRGLARGLVRGLVGVLASAPLVAAPISVASAPDTAPSTAPRHVVTDPIATPNGPNGTSRRKSLVIGIDGAGMSRIRAADTPNLDALMKTGTTSLTYRYSAAPAEFTQEAGTNSGPGWSSLLTGVWPDKHGVRDNTFVGKDFTTWPDYLTRAERIRPRLSTFAIADWDPIATAAANGPIISSEIDVRVGLKSDTDSYGYLANDARTTDVAARYVRAKGPDLSFVYLGAVDGAGHDHGSASAEYRAALETVDTQIGRLLAAIAARPSYGREQWQIIVSNDHGHRPAGGHGGPSREERQQFVIASGAGIARGLQRHHLNVTDIAATALAHVGVARDRRLDGIVISEDRSDVFDAARPRTPYDGTSHALPRGWRVDNTAMPSGGVRAWRGWVLTREPFWSAADRGQGRENFLRARGVFAVADSDEWDDAAHAAGRFDSTLISRAYAVGQRGTARLSFQTFYQQEDAQRGVLKVAFDGGRSRLLRAYTRNTFGRQSFAIPVPPGAERMRFRWRYVGNNNWYWAVDDVRVR